MRRSDVPGWGQMLLEKMSRGSCVSCQGGRPGVWVGLSNLDLLGQTSWYRRRYCYMHYYFCIKNRVGSKHHTSQSDSNGSYRNHKGRSKHTKSHSSSKC